MIGMSQIKKKFYMGLGIGASISVLVAIIAIVLYFVQISSYQNGTNKDYNEKYTRKIVVVKQNVIQGQTITNEMLSEISVHKNSVPEGAITSTSAAVGQVAKYNLVANAPLSTSMLTDKIVSTDVRTQEVNTILMPSDLAEGDYVDIRITFTNGTDYIVLAEKQVDKIVGQTMWFNLTENERAVLNSAVVDSFLNKGTKLYATKYTDPEAQVKIAEENVKVVRGAIYDLIKAEMPELLTLNGTGNNAGTESNEANLSNPAIDKVLNFIIKYNNINAVTNKTVVTYQPNNEVISAMRANANITNEAKEKLSQEARQYMENLLAQYNMANDKNMDNVVNGANTSINDQKTQRDELLGGE